MRRSRGGRDETRVGGYAAFDFKRNRRNGFRYGRGFSEAASLIREERLGIPADAPAGVAKELRRDYLPFWLPEALAQILSTLCALGGADVDPKEIVRGWTEGEADETETDLILDRWLTRNGAQEIRNDG